METNNHLILLAFLSVFNCVATLHSLLCAYCFAIKDKQKFSAIFGWLFISSSL